MPRTSPQNWTPKELRNKTAEKWQASFYGAGFLSGLISWGCFANGANSPGLVFALIAMAAFGVGSLIKTTWVKRAQVDMYVRDKAREALRIKFYGVGAVCGVIALIALASGSTEGGGFFGVLGCAAFLIGGVIPIKWIKRAEAGVYK